MISFKQKIINTSISFTALFIWACNPLAGKPDVEWNFDKAEITGKYAEQNNDKLNVDIYLDATTSMKGFASAANTNYGNLIDDIEATCQNIWKKTDVKYYEFGRTVQPISRDDFAAAKTSPLIYSDPEMSTQTNFAEAVKGTDPKRVSILITDFFYKNSDVNSVVGAVKDYCFKNGVEAGIIGLKSDFKGVVGDVTPTVSVDGVRPLYVLVFGDKQNISLFFKTLNNKPYIQRNQFLLITNRPTLGFNVNLVKDKKTKSVNKQALKKEWKDYGTVFNFRMREKDTQATFNLNIDLTLNQYQPLFTVRNLKAIVYRKSSGMKDSIPGNDKVTVENLKLIGNTIKADLKLSNTEEVGKYSYAVYFTFDNTVPFSMPKWVKDNNTDVYAQGVNEEKTLNLERLLTDIAVNHTTYVQPRLAKFYINIEKK